MAVIEIGCPACGRTLRVGKEHGGKQIRCPACQQISIAPGQPANAPPSVDGSNDDAKESSKWHVRMPDGPIYGPIEWDELLKWAAEGRIAADCEVSGSGAGPWRRAGELVPNLVVIDTRPAG